MIWFIPFLILTAVVAYTAYQRSMMYQEPFANQTKYKESKEYQDRVKLLTEKFEPYASGKRIVQELIDREPSVPESERILVNYHALACRYPGFIGPFPSGYMDPDIGVLSAVKAGCRVFVLDIDYIDKCVNDNVGYFPRLIVRDVQKKLMINEETQKPLCNTLKDFELRTICQKINDYAFSAESPQRDDPLIIVLYFHRRPPGSYKSKAVLDYYSYVARALEPFRNRLVLDEMDGGKFYRHQQEGKLLIKKIRDYKGKVLIFNNANTDGFAEVKTYSAMEDLDFLTNLRLYATQTKMGVTENATGSMFGVLQTVEDFMAIPDDRKETIQGETTLRWTIALPQNPIETPTQEVYDKITSIYGVHCVPTVLFDPSNAYLFEEAKFRRYAFRYKPAALRYRKPPIITPGQPNPTMDTNQGMLKAPGL
jgi:hypothetical protein